MFRYWQITGRDTWVPIKCSADTEEEVRRLGATKLTILSTSDVVTDETDREKIAYKGPLYFDIDVKEDLEQAIKSTRKLVGKLIELQVPVEVIRIYASGSKGMHVIVPAEVFSSGRQVKSLPYIYAEMALRLDVLGLDYQVYSGGKGVCWRLANVQRDDGKFRVPVTYEELQNLTVEKYAEYVKAPRNVTFPNAAGYESAGLAALFEQAKKAEKAKLKQLRTVPDEALEVFRETPPNCIEDLINYKVKEDTNFNAAALQLAIFCARSGSKNVASMASRLARNGHSSQYSSEKRRERHTLCLINYAEYKLRLKFSCAAIVSMLKSRPCEGCPQAKGFADGDQLAVETEIIEKVDGYYIPGEQRDRPITNFTISPIAVFVDLSTSGLVHKRAGALVEFKQNGVVIGRSLFHEAGWKSKAGFKEQILGIGKALSFTGNEDDVHRIMRMVYNTAEEVDSITQTYATGITFHKLGDRDIRVYVEPGYSINQLGVQGTHNLVGTIMGAQKLKDVRPAVPGDSKLDKVLENMFLVNRPETVAQVLGWYCASHLRTHFVHKFRGFPSLNLWGNAGAGKSRTSDLFGWLCGLDDMRSHTSINLAGVTPWPLIEFCSTSTTVPRVLEEYNKSKMRPAMYTLAGEIIKSAWDSQNLPRGTLSGSKSDGKGRTGASVVEIPITAPIVVISEQSPSMPALRQRMVQVLLSNNARKGCEKPFLYAYSNRELLKPLAKSLVVAALNTDIEWAEAKMEANTKHVPSGLDDRSRHSYKIILTGLDFMEKVLDGLSLTASKKVAELKSVLVSDLSGQAGGLIRSKKMTEVDSVFCDMAMMAGMADHSSSAAAGTWLVAGRHYVRKGNKLVIDIPIVHTIYKRYKSGLREPVVVDNTQQFIQLLSQEPYFVDGNYPAPEIVKGRGLTLLNVPILRDSGVLVDMFLES